MSDEVINLLLDSAENGNLEGVQEALENGANINVIKQWEGAALHITSSKGYLKIVKFLEKALKK